MDVTAGDDRSLLLHLASQLAATAGAKHGAVHGCARRLLDAEPALVAAVELVALAAQSESHDLVGLGLRFFLEALVCDVLTTACAGEDLRVLSHAISLAAASSDADIAILVAFATACAVCQLALEEVDAILLLGALFRITASRSSAVRKAAQASMKFFLSGTAGRLVDSLEITQLVELAARVENLPFLQLQRNYALLSARGEQQVALASHTGLFLQLCHFTEGDTAVIALDGIMTLLTSLPDASPVFSDSACKVRFSAVVDSLSAERCFNLLSTLLQSEHLRRWAREDVATLATELIMHSDAARLLEACTRLLLPPEAPLLWGLLGSDDFDSGTAVFAALASSLHRMAGDDACIGCVVQLTAAFCRFLDDCSGEAELQKRSHMLARVMPSFWPRLYTALALAHERPCGDGICMTGLRNLLHVCGTIAAVAGSGNARDAQRVLVAAMASRGAADPTALKLLLTEAAERGAQLDSACWADVFHSVSRLYALCGATSEADKLFASVQDVGVFRVLCNVATEELQCRPSPITILTENLVGVLLSFARAQSAETLTRVWKIAGESLAAPLASQSSETVQLAAASAYEQCVDLLLRRISPARLQVLQTADARRTGISLLSPALRFAELGACEDVQVQAASFLRSLVNDHAARLSATSWATLFDLCGHTATMPASEAVLSATYFALESAATSLLSHPEALFQEAPRASLLAALLAWSRQRDVSRALDAIGLVTVVTPHLCPLATGAPVEDVPDTAISSLAGALDHTTSLSGLSAVALAQECSSVVRIEALNAVFDCAQRCADVHAWGSAEWRNTLADNVTVVLDGLLRQHAEQADATNLLLTAVCLILERTVLVFTEHWELLQTCFDYIVLLLATCIELDWPALSQHATVTLLRLVRKVGGTCDAQDWSMLLSTLTSTLEAMLRRNSEDIRGVLEACAQTVTLSRYCVATEAALGSSLARLVNAIGPATSLSVEVALAALEVLSSALHVPDAAPLCIDICSALVENPSTDLAVAMHALRLLERAPDTFVGDRLPALLRRKHSLATADD